MHIGNILKSRMETNPLALSSQRDNIFARPRPPGRPFQFDEEVAEVFDDMLARSIPFYNETQGVIADLVTRHLPPHGRLYDLGCSTGNTLLVVASLLKQIDRNAQLIGVDQSLPLVRRCRDKLVDHNRCHILHRNVLDILPSRSHFTILNYTLQFLPQRSVPNFWSEFTRDSNRVEWSLSAKKFSPMTTSSKT